MRINQPLRLKSRDASYLFISMLHHWDEQCSITANVLYKLYRLRHARSPFRAYKLSIAKDCNYRTVHQVSSQTTLLPYICRDAATVVHDATLAQRRCEVYHAAFFPYFRARPSTSTSVDTNGHGSHWRKKTMTLNRISCSHLALRHIPSQHNGSIHARIHGISPSGHQQSYRVLVHTRS